MTAMNTVEYRQLLNDVYDGRVTIPTTTTREAFDYIEAHWPDLHKDRAHQLVVTAIDRRERERAELGADGSSTTDEVTVRYAKYDRQTGDQVEVERTWTDEQMHKHLVQVQEVRASLQEVYSKASSLHASLNEALVAEYLLAKKLQGLLDENPYTEGYQASRNNLKYASTLYKQINNADIDPAVRRQERMADIDSVPPTPSATTGDSWQGASTEASLLRDDLVRQAARRHRDREMARKRSEG